MKILFIFVLFMVSITLSGLIIDLFSGIKPDLYFANLYHTFVLFSPVEMLLIILYVMLIIATAFASRKKH